MPDLLEQRLAALGSELEFPPTPDLAPAVMAQVSTARPRPRRRLVPARRTVAVALALLALLAAAAAAVEPVRHAVRDLLGLEGATVERVPRLPVTPGGLDLGRPGTLETATQRASFAVRVPGDSSLGAPDAVYLRGRGSRAVVTLLFRPQPGLPPIAAGSVGLLLTQFRGDLSPLLVEKFIGPGTGTRELRVGAERGFWIQGPHSFAYRDDRGEVRVEERRLAANTLLWQDGRVLLRLESRLGLERTLAIARSLD